MNDQIKGIPFSEAPFDKDGKPLGQPTVPPGTTDLIVMSHGWNNDQQDAEGLYQKLFGNFADVTAGDPAITSRRIAVVGVIWPSKKFDDFITQVSAANPVAGGAAAFGGTVKRAKSEAAMHAAIDRVAPLFDDAGDGGRLQALHDLVPRLDGGDAAQARFVETLRALLDPDGSRATQQSKDDGSAVFFRGPADVIFSRAATVEAPPAPAVGEEPAVRAAGFGDFFSGVANGVSNLLNLTTYFEMKQRAGTVGTVGLAPLLDRLAAQVERIHLAGHSFGGRLVTAASAGSTTPKLRTLSLLQAAFSHNAFSKTMHGFFRDVIQRGRISGPILITYTRNDRAVGLAYPTASRISRDSASVFGGADDIYGGMGGSGAQQMEAGEIDVQTHQLLAVGQPYDFKPGKIHNLESSDFIVAPNHGDAHGFVFVPQVAWALSRLILA